MSDRLAGLIVDVVNLIGKVLLAILLAFLLWYAVYLFLADTECQEPDCSWLADNVFTGNWSVYLLAVCVLVAVGLVWGIPAIRRRRTSRRAKG